MRYSPAQGNKYTHKKWTKDGKSSVFKVGVFMRDLERNKQKIWYAKYSEKTPILDEDGYETGEYSVGYTNPQSFKINVYATAGNTRQQAFGYNLEYSRTMCTCDKSFQLSEGDLLWIDRVPALNQDGSLVISSDGVTPTVPPDYYVSAIGYSQNCTNTTYAITKKE